MHAVFPCRRWPQIFVMAGLVLGAVSSLSSAVVYDFVAKAPEAKWARALSALGELPWNGPDNDNRGFVRHLANVPLENGKTFALVLETHPEWKKGGMVYGVYSTVAVPANAKFTALVGFLKDATTTDGATFEVHAFDQTTGAIHIIAAKTARADGVLDELAADLGAYAGKTMIFRLQVAAGETARQDWAVWASAAITQEGALVLQRAAVGVKPVATAKLPAQQPSLATVQRFQPAVIKRIPLTPIGTLPAKHKIEDVGPLPIEEPLTLLNRIYKDNEKPNTFYYLPREINLIR